jgi:transcriptional regulator with XRE-family HTH domain
MNSTQTDKLMKKFGKHLKKIREEKNLSLRKLADIADVDFSQIHRIEQGTSNPGLIMLFTLADALEVDITELLRFQ